MSESELRRGEDPDGEADWIIAKLLLDATERSFAAFEHHARYALYHEGNADTEEIRRQLEQAKVYHERIIDDIDTALAALDDSSST
ncbi:MAG: hypothetical protein ABEJ08_01125 [Halobacteriaceae archaeon]